MAVIKLVEDVFAGRVAFMPAGKYLRTPEILKKQSEAHLGHEVSAGARANQSLAQRGRKHSPESIAKRVATRKAKPEPWHSDETKQKIGMGKLGTVVSEETREKLSAHMTRENQRRWADDEFKRKTSAAIREAWLGEPFPGQFRGSSGYHNGVRMRCLNSEGVFAKALDEGGIEWVYEPRRFKLSWTTYCPDFYLPEFNIWVEVKGYMTDQALAKIETFRRETGKCLVVVRQHELPSLSYGEEEP